MILSLNAIAIAAGVTGFLTVLGLGILYVLAWAGQPKNGSIHSVERDVAVAGDDR